MSAPNSAAASIIANVERARVALASITSAVESLAGRARFGGATWAQFLNPDGGL